MSGNQSMHAKTGDSTDVRPAAPAHVLRRAKFALTAILVVALIQQIAIIGEGLRSNPLASTPVVDAKAYWEHAGDIARGKLVADKPFMGAPLYVYVLGLVRALGGGLHAAIVLQVALHLVTIAMLGWFTTKRFGPLVGCCAAAIYALLTEAAFYPGRLLACTLHAFLVSVLYVSLVAAQSRPAPRRFGIAGLLAGLNAVANPPMLLAILLLAPWVAWCEASLRRGLIAVIAFCIGAALAIAPATLHNFIAAREFILISGQAGVTFAQGNSAKAVGVYAPLPGISRDRTVQNEDALRIVRRQKDAGAGWRDVNAYFFAQGRAFISAQPAVAANLFGKKLAWFLCSGVYGDIYLPVVERNESLARALWAAPLPLPAIVWPALLVIAALALHPRRHGPEIVLALLPLVVVLLFFYSPRYRFPAAPVLAIAAAVGVKAIVDARRRPAWAAAVATATIAGPIIALAVTSRPGDLHDTSESWRAFLLQKLAKLSADQNQFPQAIDFARRAIAADARDALSFQILAHALESTGDVAGAIGAYQAAISLDASSADPRYRLGELLLKSRRVAEGMQAFDDAVAVAPRDAEAHFRRALALAAIGQTDQAELSVERAIEIAGQDAGAEVAVRYRRRWDEIKAKAGARP